MARMDKHYPNITWAQFAMCNDDITGAFEDMTRRLFTFEFLKNSKIPHSDHNNPGVEVLPILEPPHKDGAKQRRISFQSKYFEGNVRYSKIKESFRQAVKHYGNELDLIYLFCNKTLTVTTKGYKEIEAVLIEAGIELYPISNSEVLDLVSKYKEIANYFFLPRKRPDDVSPSQIHATIVVNNGENVTGCIDCPIQLKDQIIDPRLLQSFVQEKLSCVSLSSWKWIWKNLEKSWTRYLYTKSWELRELKHYCFINSSQTYMRGRLLKLTKKDLQII